VIALGDVAALDYGWSDRDVILYALSVGAQLPGDLSLVYEEAPLRTAPTFALAAMAGLVMPMVQAFGIEVGSLLHAGQEVVVHAPMPVSGIARVTRRVVEVVDKGRAALVVCEDAVGEWATGRSTWWIAGAGGAGSSGGGGSSPPFVPPAAPTAAPGFSRSWATSPEQAALHRLNGDRNPVHIDPAAAAATGQPRPFLHGLCTFGALALALDRSAGPDRRLTSLAGRFTQPVFPGDTLAFEAWDDLAVARVSVGGTPVLGPAVATYAG
jgi:acyl dehydratase